MIEREDVAAIVADVLASTAPANVAAEPDLIPGHNGRTPEELDAAKVAADVRAYSKGYR